MTDYQEVRPHITDPDLIPAPNRAECGPKSPEIEQESGLFTTMKENYIIVIIIVIVIIVIGVIAYIVYRKSDDSGPPPRIAQQSTQSLPPAATQATQAVLTPEKVTPQERDSIRSLYERSKKGDAKPKAAEVTEYEDNIKDLPADSRSQDDISQLMEDPSQADDPPQAADDGPTTPAPDDENPRSGYCSELLKGGRFCRNKNISNGKCKTHGG